MAMRYSEGMPFTVPSGNGSRLLPEVRIEAAELFVAYQELAVQVNLTGADTGGV
jgi:hypothetical protein